MSGPAGLAVGRGTLRRRVLVSITAVAALAVVLFAVPLALAVRSLYLTQARDALEREAARVIAWLPDEQTGTGTPLPHATDADVSLGLYGATGQRLAGTGPESDAAAVEAARTGVVRSTSAGGVLAVYFPVQGDGTAEASVRAAEPLATVQSRVWRAWAAMAGIGLLVVLVAGLVGLRAARRLSAPLESLAASARALGGGDFATDPPRTGMRETDVVGDALRSAARRIGAQLERERAFSADASHQMRTPLTALRVTLEGALATPGADVTAAAESSLREVDRLEATVEDLLALARDLPEQRLPLALDRPIAALGDRWAARAAQRDRPLVVRVEAGLPEVEVSPAALDQVLDVLVDNALEHGAGPVEVRARAAGTGVAVEVLDSGTLPARVDELFGRRVSGAGGSGIGLALARSLAEAEGGRLTGSTQQGRTCFALLLPPAADR